MIWHVKEIQKQIKDQTIVAATKYFNASEMRELYKEGISHFGENRVELLIEKQEQLQDLDITWHIIGTLQTKKVKKVINQIEYLHSLDNFKLANEINKRRTAPLKCFIQVNISNEESKHGLDIDDVIPFIKEIQELPNIQVIGLMGMAAYTTEESIINVSFQSLNTLLNKINQELNMNINDLSIGMSNDYLIATSHNSTFLRLGSCLFEKEV